jgi:hypothetical protein
MEELKHGLKYFQCLGTLMFLSHVYLIPCTFFLLFEFQVWNLGNLFLLFTLILFNQISIYLFFFFLACCYVCWFFLVIFSLMTPWIVNYLMFFFKHTKVFYWSNWFNFQLFHINFLLVYYSFICWFVVWHVVLIWMVWLPLFQIFSLLDLFNY